MTNLRTDDILGARPRIRHAPLSLIRQQKLVEQYSHYPPPFQYDQAANNRYSNADPQHRYQYPYNAPQNNPINSPRNQPSANMQPLLHQYQDNGRRQPRFTDNLDMSRSYMEKSPDYAGKASEKIHDNINVIDRYDEQIRNRASQRLFIKPKDAPVVNYNQYQKIPEQLRNQNNATTYTRTYNNPNKDIYDRYNYNSKGNRVGSVQLSQSRQMSSYQLPVRNMDKIENKRNSKSSARSSIENNQTQGQNYQQKQQAVVPQSPRQIKNKNFFRGLGYNIITNSKFEYGMENRYKNTTSKWLE